MSVFPQAAAGQDDGPHDELAAPPVLRAAVDIVPHGRVRRVLECVIAFAALVVLLPVMAVIAALVVATSPGPVFFRHERVGHGGRSFVVLKFRTMSRDADLRAVEVFARADDGSGPLHKLRDDPRVTPIGRWLRRYSLDELPQLWNVLNGTMALVGPRPTSPAEVAGFAPHEHRRCAVRPGITGLAQISGRSNLAWDDAVALDFDYIDRRSHALDLWILLRTLPAVLSARGAY